MVLPITEGEENHAPARLEERGKESSASTREPEVSALDFTFVSQFKCISTVTSQQDYKNTAQQAAYAS